MAVRIEILCGDKTYMQTVVTALVAVRIEIGNVTFPISSTLSPPLWR